MSFLTKDLALNALVGLYIFESGERPPSTIPLPIIKKRGDCGCVEAAVDWLRKTKDHYLCIPQLSKMPNEKGIALAFAHIQECKCDEHNNKRDAS